EIQYTGDDQHVHDIPTRRSSDLADEVRRIVEDTISGADDGELYLERSQAESLLFDNGRLKTANYNTDQGFVLRAVAGESTGYAKDRKSTRQNSSHVKFSYAVFCL